MLSVFLFLLFVYLSLSFAVACTCLPRCPCADTQGACHRSGHSALCRGCLGLFMQQARPVCLICRQRVTQETLIMSDTMASEVTFVRPVRA
jgi:hypothetical protein